MRKMFFFLVTIIFVFSCTVFYYKINKNNIYDNEIMLADTNLVGDINGDNRVSVADYNLVRKHILGNKLTADKYKKADINSDGKVTVADYNLIRKIILGTYKPIPNIKAKLLDNGDSYEVYNYDVVDDFGADPTGKNDSTSSFKAAIMKATKCTKATDNNKCGSIIYIPSGIYKITDTIELPFYVELIGEKNSKTVLSIEHSKGSAIVAYAMSSIKNIMFYYPNQNINSPVNYPATITYKTFMSNKDFYGKQVTGTDGITLENITFINSYVAMDLTGAIFYIRDIKGTPLNIGLINDGNLDTIKMDNISFNSSYWKNYNDTISNKKTLNELDNYLYKNAIGIIIKRVDWYMLSKINVAGYNIGIKLDNNGLKDAVYGGKSEGELFDSTLTNCKYSLQVSDAKHTVISNTTLSSKDGRALNIDSGIGWDFSIYGSTITSNGDYAIYHNGPGALTITNSKVTGKISKTNKPEKLSIIGTSLSNTGIDNRSINVNLKLFNNVISDYTKKVVFKPVKINLNELKMVSIEANKNEDITNSIKNAITSLEKTGGIIYIPNGIYKISDTIKVPSKIEIRGGTPWAHHSRMIRDERGNGIGSTIIDISSLDTKKNAFTLSANSGLNGFDIIKIKNDTMESAFVISGSGANIYVTNINIPGTWNGININGDNHFVEHIWGGFYNEGIRLNGKNGMIRNCHITRNSLYFADLDAKLDTAREAIYRKHKTIIVTGEGETLYNLFVFGPGVGYSFENAKNFNAIGIASDASGTAISITGASTGKIINPMLVSRSYDVTDQNGKIVTKGSLSRYIKTSANFQGQVDIINSMNWGNRNAISFEFAGTSNADLHIYGGLIDDSKNDSKIKSENISSTISLGAITVSGIVIRTPNIKTFQFNAGVHGAQLVGNVCEGYNSCKDGLINNAGINIGVANPITK